MTTEGESDRVGDVECVRDGVGRRVRVPVAADVPDIETLGSFDDVIDLDRASFDILRVAVLDAVRVPTEELREALWDVEGSGALLDLVMEGPDFETLIDHVIVVVVDMEGDSDRVGDSRETVLDGDDRSETDDVVLTVLVLCGELVPPDGDSEWRDRDRDSVMVTV